MLPLEERRHKRQVIVMNENKLFNLQKINYSKMKFNHEFLLLLGLFFHK
uniref:Uncharacterized protein n=1 Tax=Rhizophora mucronata TaxID=61149 RepID=A0A2P2QEQ6_RHIMU